MAVSVVQNTVTRLVECACISVLGCTLCSVISDIRIHTKSVLMQGKYGGRGRRLLCAP